MKPVYLKLGLCALIATLLALTSHIYIFEWLKPTIEQMAREVPSGGPYSSNIIFAAYGTAFITLGVTVFLYYQAGHLITVSNPFLKSLLLAAIIFCAKGDLLRQAFMDYLVYCSMGAKSPFLLMCLNHVDKWVANLLVAFCLVYLCPLKQNGKQKKGE